MSSELLQLRFLSPVRDGGLKRGKVKDSFKEEQQKMYSSTIVGQNGIEPPGTCGGTEEDQ